MKMTQYDYESRVQKIVTAINRQDLNILLDYLADDVIAHLSGFDETIDKNTMRECWSGWYAAFPDLTYHVDRIVSQGTSVVVEITATGTHKGDLRGIAATHKTVKAQEIWILDFKDGKVTCWKEYYNIPGFASAQLAQFLGA